MTAILERPAPAVAEALTRRRLDGGIDALRSDLIRMMDLARYMLKDAMTALHTGDTGLAESVIERDAEVDELDRCIETRAICLVGTQQPVAYDLRFVGTVLKVTTDVERIGDHAVNIARVVIRLMKCPGQMPVPVETERMGTIALELLRATAESFANDDAVTAQTVIERDDELDILYRETQTELRHRMIESPPRSVAASHLLFVAHYLERVGDHCANAAERLDYLVTGRVPYG
ncbi:MAG: phosphate signaling complex protein PhoU [Akkermansiaceae bacterium]|nr:phosphate signaling complex protein PhoU [Armatimonadota bacterium]